MVDCSNNISLSCRTQLEEYIGWDQGKAFPSCQVVTSNQQQWQNVKQPLLAFVIFVSRQKKHFGWKYFKQTHPPILTSSPTLSNLLLCFTILNVYHYRVLIFMLVNDVSKQSFFLDLSFNLKILRYLSWINRFVYSTKNDQIVGSELGSRSDDRGFESWPT